MGESVLLSVKKMLGIHQDDDSFDIDIILHINSVISILMDLGINEVENQLVEDDTKTWSELLGRRNDINYVKTYIYQKVRLMFDPPTSAAAIEAMQRSVSELEWRICNNWRDTQHG